MIEVGQFIEVDLLNDGNKEVYFRTEVVDTRYGVDYYFFCKVRTRTSNNDIALSDMWGMSENYFQNLLKVGQLRVLDEHGQ